MESSNGHDFKFSFQLKLRWGLPYVGGKQNMGNSTREKERERERLKERERE